MQLFTTFASLSTLALSIFVAVRLLLAAARTRGAAELAMGAYQALVVTAILVYVVVRGLSERGQTEPLFGLVVLANGLIALGVIALSVGVWRIYRASEAWAAAACAALSLWVIAGWGWTSLGEILPVTSATTPANAFFVTGRSAVYLWGGIEGLRYYRMMRRRAELGLGDPLVAHQILLWGCFSLAMGSLAVGSLAAGLALGEAYATSWPALVMTPVVSLVASVCLWLGFFPPARYCRFIAGDAEAIRS